MIFNNLILYKLISILTIYFFFIHQQDFIYIMSNYLERLKNKLKVKKFDSNQPIKAWLFVLILNIVGFAGYFYLKINDIHLGD